MDSVEQQMRALEAEEELAAVRLAAIVAGQMDAQSKQAIYKIAEAEFKERADALEKLVAQAAYEAYCATTEWKSAISGAPLPQWSDVLPNVQSAWRAAAIAVMRHCLMSIPR